MIRRLAIVILTFVAAGCGRDKAEPSSKAAEASKPEPAPAPKADPKPPPPPKPARKRNGDSIAGWGTINDPDADCVFLASEDTVSIEITGKLHDINPTKDRRNSPRILRDVEGDFRAVVRVTGDFQPVPPSTSRTSVPFNGAGLLAWADETNLAVVARNHFILNNTDHVCFAPLFDLSQDGKSVLGNTPIAPATTFKGESTALYLERKGKLLRAAYSHDAKTWEGWRECESSLPSKLKVGVVSISTSSRPFIVTFDGFKLLE